MTFANFKSGGGAETVFAGHGRDSSDLLKSVVDSRAVTKAGETLRSVCLRLRRIRSQPPLTRRLPSNTTYLVELPRVVVAVVNADLASVDARVTADAEVVRHERIAVGLQHNVSLQESALRRSRVNLLGLGHHDGLVFQVVEDGDLSDLVVLEAALDDVLLEVTEESEDLI